MSVSWGQCENTTSSNTRTADDLAFVRILAAGATIFTSSGDTGAYDCVNNWNTLAVEWPASDSQVVAVGGSSVLANYNGLGADSAWGPPTVPTGSGSKPSATGGGQSTLIARPGYQSGFGIAGSGRLVPDISAEADPSSGYLIQYDGNWGTVGGTSLATPLMAGWVMDMLSSTLPVGAPATRGYGDIHSVLYAGAGVTRDITTGTNDYYAAGPGYDEVTGMGQPVLTGLQAALNPGQQVLPAPITPIPGPLPGPPSTLPVVATYLTPAMTLNLKVLGRGLALTETSTVSGPGYLFLGRLTNLDTDGTVVVHALTSRTFVGLGPGRWQFEVIVRLPNGVIAGPYTSNIVAVAVDSTAIAHSSGWKVTRSGSDLGGSALTATTKGASATGKVMAGSPVHVALKLLRSSGTVSVKVDGRTVINALKVTRATTYPIAQLRAGNHRVTVTLLKGSVTLDALTLS